MSEATNAKPLHMNDEIDAKTNDLCECMQYDRAQMG